MSKLITLLHELSRGLEYTRVYPDRATQLRLSELLVSQEKVLVGGIIHTLVDEPTRIQTGYCLSGALGGAPEPDQFWGNGPLLGLTGKMIVKGKPYARTTLIQIITQPQEGILRLPREVRALEIQGLLQEGWDRVQHVARYYPRYLERLQQKKGLRNLGDPFMRKLLLKLFYSDAGDLENFWIILQAAGHDFRDHAKNPNQDPTALLPSLFK